MSIASGESRENAYSMTNIEQKFIFLSDINNVDRHSQLVQHKRLISYMIINNYIRANTHILVKQSKFQPLLEE